MIESTAQLLNVDQVVTLFAIGANSDLKGLVFQLEPGGIWHFFAGEGKGEGTFGVYLSSSGFMILVGRDSMGKGQGIGQAQIPGKLGEKHWG